MRRLIFFERTNIINLNGHINKYLHISYKYLTSSYNYCEDRYFWSEKAQAIQRCALHSVGYLVLIHVIHMGWGANMDQYQQFDRDHFDWKQIPRKYSYTNIWLGTIRAPIPYRNDLCIRLFGFFYSGSCAIIVGRHSFGTIRATATRCWYRQGCIDYKIGWNLS